MKTIHVRFPNLKGKSYNQAAKQNELKLITKVKKIVQKEKNEHHGAAATHSAAGGEGFAGGRPPCVRAKTHMPAQKKKPAKTFVLE